MDATVTPEERNLLLGQTNSVAGLPDELRFEAIGAVPVPCRASVTRVRLLPTLTRLHTHTE